MAGDIFTQNHTGSGNNVINVGKPELTEISLLQLEVVAQKLAEALKSGKPLRAVGVAGKKGDFVFADTVANFLASKGFKCEEYSKAYSYNQVPPMQEAISIIEDKNHILLSIDPKI